MSLVRVFPSLAGYNNGRLSFLYVRRSWAKDLHHYEFGIHEATFVYLAKFYTMVLEKLGIPLGCVPCESSEDESACQDDPRWNQRRDQLIGFCGPKLNAPDRKRGKNQGHKCECNFKVPVGSGVAGYERMVNAYQFYKRAKYLRVMMVNPLHPKVPCVAMSLQCTCNQFTAADVSDQWDRVEALWDKHLRPVLGPLWGFGSDGDARRFSIQKSRMLSTNGPRFRCSWRGFVYSARVKPNGDLCDIMSQDSFHDSKKMSSAMAVASRDLAMGTRLATQYHIELVGDPSLFRPSDHGLHRRDIVRKDPMSMKTIERTLARKVDGCLESLAESMKQKEGGLRNLLSPETTARFADKEWPPEDTLGTRTWLGVIRTFLRIFFSTKDSLEKRYENCAFVVSFLRLKRQWIHADDSYELKHHAESAQCFDHVVLQCESAALKIEAFREFFATQPCFLARSGSDCCETFFSKLGGFGAIQLNRRNFNCDDALETACDLLKLVLYEFDPECPMIVKKANDSLELIMKELEENNDVPDADLTDYPSKAQCVSAGDRGLVRAQELAATLGMDNRKPRPKWWTEPWMNESTMTHEMRDADADDNIVERIVDPVFRTTVSGPEREVGEAVDEQRDVVAEEREESADGAGGSADGAGGSEPDAGAATEAAVPHCMPCRPAARKPRTRSQIARYATMEDDGDHEDAVRARHEYRDVIDSVHVVEEAQVLPPLRRVIPRRRRVDASPVM